MDIVTLRRQALERVFARMNPPQRQAVFHTEGALLILAGAGSGKTTVLVNRIANLIRFGQAYHSDIEPLLSDGEEAALLACAEGRAELDDALAAQLAVDPCPAWQILAITFTNKAAGELKSRLAAMLGPCGEEVMAGTFHAFCARVLRRDGDRLGYSRSFTIYDTDDSRRLTKDCMKTLNIDEKLLGHKAILAEINRAKDALRTPERFAAEAGADHRMRKIAECYTLYQQRLRDADAMDFNDLLMQAVALLEQQPDVLEAYRRRYRYLMVDEYQDTNHAQYRLISLLAAGRGNLCVVGDDDQSIYKFRGATIENILGFEQEFTGCAVIRLEQNYRSTGSILDAANAVIAHNTQRKPKTLWTENPRGEPLSLHIWNNEDEEGQFIADTVVEGVARGRRFADFAILYRANAQSNALERTLIKSGIPYRIFGGHRFFDHKEVRDAVAYLRIIANPGDSVSLRRVINEPKRGIGDATVDAGAALAASLGLSLYAVLHNAGDYPALSRAAGKLRMFFDMLDALAAMNADPDTSLDALYTALLEQTGYLAMWEAQGPEGAGRVDNLKELASSIQDYERQNEDASLGGFLEEVALMTDIDNYDTSTDAMVLMTMHAAKGLEFPELFLPGFEDGVFPGMQSLLRPEEMEEERRLCYVALTRARERLYLSRAASRTLYGATNRNRASRFLLDIPETLLDTHDHTDYAVKGYGYRPGGDDFPRAERKPTVPAFGTASAFGSASAFTPPTGARQPSAGIDWQAGDRLRHPSFGEGTVQSVKPMGGDLLLEIRFVKVGTKKIMANFAKMTRLE